LLSSEVVYDKETVVGLHLQRSLIEFGDRVKVEIQRLQRQFPAGHDHGSAHLDPSLIRGRIAVMFGFNRNIVSRVVYGNDFATYQNGMRHVDGTGEDVADGLGNGGLTVAWGAIEEDRFAGTYGRPQPL